MRLSRFSALLGALALTAALPLGGCSEEPQNGGGDAGTDAGVGDLEAYFSLQKGRCFEYTLLDSRQATADLGVAVEEIDMNQFAQAAPQGTHVVRYRQGFPKMTDYVSFTAEGELKLHKREYFGGKSFIYKPAVTLMRAPAKGNDTLTTGEKVDVRDSQGNVIAQGESYTRRYDTLDATELRLPIGETVSAYRYIYDETWGSQAALERPETRAFVPGDGDRSKPHGFVTIEYNFENDETQPKKVYRLQNVRELVQGGDPCGSSL
ncbi:MAG: hypothetical protein ACK4N5_15940 [Myxococcales bacterium]